MTTSLLPLVFFVSVPSPCSYHGRRVYKVSHRKHKKFNSLRTFARKTSTTQIFFILWLQSDNELPISEMQKNWGLTDFVFEIKRVENYPNVENLALVTRHGLSTC